MDGFLRNEWSESAEYPGFTRQGVGQRLAVFKRPIEETDRRRKKQIAYNEEHGITPQTIKRKIADIMDGAYASAHGDAKKYAKVAEEVVEYAAIGIPDPKWGERPLMIVTLKPEYQGKVTAEELKAYMLESVKQGNLPAYGVPDRYEFAEALPKTSVGKLDKKVLRKQYT